MMLAMYIPVIPERNPWESKVQILSYPRSKSLIPTGAFSISSSSSTARSGFTKVLACKRTAPASSVPGAASTLILIQGFLPKCFSSSSATIYNYLGPIIQKCATSASLGTSRSLAFYPSRGFLHLPIHGTAACHCLQVSLASGLVPIR